jgi:Icc-related predicted phosphoesterase
MKVLAFSDTHLRSLPPLMRGKKADLFICAGDLLNSGSARDWIEVLPELKILREQCNHFVVVPGNHDWFIQQNTQIVREQLAELDIHLLIDQEVEIEGKRIYGSPWTPRFGGWAFMKERGEEMRRVWNRIPEGLDLLVLHGPPHGILDATDGRYTGGVPMNVGCEELRRRLDEMPSPPRFVVFGHIHNGHGKLVTPKTTYFNVAICDESYNATNPVTEFEI